MLNAWLVGLFVRVSPVMDVGKALLQNLPVLGDDFPSISHLTLLQMSGP